MNSEKHQWVSIIPLQEEFFLNEIIEIIEDEFHYLKNVLRVQEGSFLKVLNGKGFVGKGIIKEIKKKSLEVEILEVFKFKKAFNKQIEIVIGALKPSNLENLLPLISELNLDKISIIKTDKSFNKYSIEKVEKWQKICFESLRISKSPFVCEMNYFDSLREFLDRKNNENENIHFLCDEEIIGKVKKSLISKLNSLEINNFNKLVFFIGPESGWTSEEKKRLEEKLKIERVELSSNMLSAVMATMYVSIIAEEYLKTVSQLQDHEA